MGDPGLPGRFCPADYGLGEGAFLRAPWIDTDCLYVVGGLYGNTEALAALEALFAAERAAAPRLVFNGDFHWFDVDPAEFARIEAGTARHLRLRGNVETELARAVNPGDGDAGCGCAYPDEVDDGVVERSNRILGRLRETARAHGAAAALGALPMVARARVAGLGVAITHGDEVSLAGWRLAHDRLGQSWSTGLARTLRHVGARVMASSHTCLAVAQTFSDEVGTLAAINNGAAGLGNFAGSPAGLITRIAPATLPPPAAARECYAWVVDGVRVSALALDFDTEAWLTRFDDQWPAGSDAERSYRHRVIHGTSLPVHQAAQGGFAVCA